MAIDASIYQGVKTPEPFNPLAEMAQVQHLQGMQTQNRLAGLQFADRERAIADAETQREAVRGFGSDTTANYNRLLQTGNLGAAQLYQKGVGEQAKLRAETGKTSAETTGKAFGTFQQIIGTVQTRDQALRAMEAAFNDPTIGPVLQLAGRGKTLEQAAAEIPMEGTPQWQEWQAKASIGAAKLAELAKVQNVNLGGTMATQVVQPATGQVTQLASAPITQSADSIASNATQVRGQNLTDARAREVVAQGRVPSGYRARSDGTLEFIPGGPADPATAKRAAPTEFQGKSAAFGGRAQEADKIITGLTGKYSPAAINSKQAAGEVWGIGGALEAGANALLTDAGQKAEQAQRDFVNAVLRQESGAAIGKDEFDNARRQYFPQPNDGEAVIKQKAQNRKLAIQGLTNNAGNATVPKPASDGWSVEEVKK